VGVEFSTFPLTYGVVLSFHTQHLTVPQIFPIMHLPHSDIISLFHGFILLSSFLSILGSYRACVKCHHTIPYHYTDVLAEWIELVREMAAEHHNVLCHYTGVRNVSCHYTCHYTSVHSVSCHYTGVRNVSCHS